MPIHFLPVLVCAIVSMILGSVWYGPLFGKTWMRLLNVNPEDFKDPEKCKKVQKEAMPMYFIQFAISLLQIGVLSYYIGEVSSISALENSLLLYAGFILPTIAGIIWNGDSKKIMLQKFIITASFQLVLAIAFGLILSIWR